MKRLPVLIIILLFTLPFLAQQKDTIVLMNGNTVIEQVTDTSLFAVTVLTTKTGKKISGQDFHIYTVCTIITWYALLLPARYHH